MPAIPPERRALFKEELDALLCRMRDFELKKGDVTYLITEIAVAYVLAKGKNYDSLCDVDGIFGTAAKEFYRQVTGPYEAKKFKQNDPANTIYGEILD